MATRLEGVVIPVELDTGKAQRQLDNLEGKLAKDQKKALDVNRTLNTNSLLSGGGKGAKTGTTGVGGLPQQKISIPTLAQNAVQGSTPVSGVLNKIGSIASKVPSAAALAEGAVTAGALYGAVRTVALGAPLALEAGRSFVGLSKDDPNFAAVSRELENLRSTVSYLESYIKSAITGIGKTYDMATAMARVNGKLPNIQIGYGIYKEADMEEDLLNKKFEEFKQLEVANAVGVSMSELFKNGMNK